MHGAGSAFGLTRQGECVSADDRCLRNYFEILSADDERKRREKVAGKITVLDHSLEDTVPYLFSLLGIVEGDDPLAQTDGQIKKRRTLEAIKRILLRESLKQPLMVVFEDLYWMDGENEGLLNLLADSIGTSRVLLLVNYRPEYRHQWGSKTYYIQLRLDPLGKESALLLIKDRGNLVEAQRCLRTAIDVARRQVARLFELRATVSLARLSRDSDRREACATLAEICGWFTEGFDTADLKDAKALLDELTT